MNNCKIRRYVCWLISLDFVNRNDNMVVLINIYFLSFISSSVRCRVNDFLATKSIKVKIVINIFNKKQYYQGNVIQKNIATCLSFLHDCVKQTYLQISQFRTLNQRLKTIADQAFSCCSKMVGLVRRQMIMKKKYISA